MGAWSGRQQHTAPELGHMKGNLQGIGGSQFGYGHLNLRPFQAFDMGQPGAEMQSLTSAMSDAKRALDPEGDHPGEQSGEPRITLEPQRTPNSQIVGGTHTQSTEGPEGRVSLEDVFGVTPHSTENLSHRWLDWCLGSPNFDQSPHILLSAISICV